jgi:hypothetical protein
MGTIPSTLIGVPPFGHEPNTEVTGDGAMVVVVGTEAGVVVGMVGGTPTGVVVIDDAVALVTVVGIVPTLQPYTPDATMPQYEPSGRPNCGPGHVPMLTSAMQIGPLLRQKIPRTPSTLISYSPLAHCEPSVGTGTDGGTGTGVVAGGLELALIEGTGAVDTGDCELPVGVVELVPVPGAGGATTGLDPLVFGLQP